HEIRHSRSARARLQPWLCLLAPICEPQAERLFSRHSFHVTWAAIGLIVFPHQQTRRKSAQAPSRFMHERNIWMLLVVDFERLKKLTKSRDGCVLLHGAPSVGGMESHFPSGPGVRES